MFCPLCQSEYRDGFTQCSECRVALVPTLEEATAASSRLWRGDSQKELDRILAALYVSQIPCHFKEYVGTVPYFKIPSVLPVRPRFESEVWVFCRDLARAQAAIAVNVDDDDDDE